MSPSFKKFLTVIASLVIGSVVINIGFLVSPPDSWGLLMVLIYPTVFIAVIFSIYHLLSNGISLKNSLHLLVSVIVGLLLIVAAWVLYNILIDSSKQGNEILIIIPVTFFFGAFLSYRLLKNSKPSTLTFGSTPSKRV